MGKLLITMLGTGDAIGTPKIGCKCPTCLDALGGGLSRRMRFSVLLESDDGRVLVDTSPDLRWQLLKRDLSKVDAVIWTHAHYDHYAGFGDFHRVQNRVPVYGTKGTMDYIMNYLYFLRPERHDVLAGVPFELAGMDFTLFPVDHPPVETMGVLVEAGGKRAVITSDTTDALCARSMELMAGVDLFLADAIMPPGYNLNKHMNAEQAMALARRLNVRKTYLTHLSHLYPPHDQAVQQWPLAYDMMEIEL
ncbi:MAG: putative hydrolase [Methanosaeta sp. PtaB.Bin039]|nr:MAG: putative hydrolase [Methanosaeta sp. PtaB.Bin039]OPY44959.1 MAG: putative hydrolase [Methanosaeta sp. PtaU1.Bin028]HOT07400.1 MBL fold metallo-hydrolase [Methanotrichaceae archaeon]HQF15884.1 MBL fold metallo-hydrolase [Methanotrichaceae archaeon]HQI90440.1 MBL fold metallo-hydrolase [Methanotrichaceae archaeon]